MEKELYLVFVNPVGKNSNNNFEYEFFFSETPDMVWAEDWNIESPSACSNIIPQEDMYSLVEKAETSIPLKCAQENSCFSMQDCIDGVLALLFENLTGYEMYPEPYRIVIKYGETYEKVKEILEGREIYFQ